MLTASISDIWYSYSFEYRFYMIVIAAFVILTVVGIIVQLRVNSAFSKYDVPARCGLPAAVVARRMLDAHGLYNVKIVRISGHLTDNFNPRTNTLSLSQSVYGSSSISAIGVACHEAGHAVQHAKKFVFASARLKLVPVVNFANRMMFPILLIGMLFGFASPYTLVGNILIYIGLVVFGLSLLFSLVTLPTEFDASRRAQKELRASFFTSEEAAMSRKVLSAAAMTYVISFLTALLQFLRFVVMLLMANRYKRR